VRTFLTGLIPLLAVVAFLLGLSSPAGAGHAVASANDRSATATFFSELGPASSAPPRESRMPLADSADDEVPAPWPRLAGIALAIGGTVLVYTSLRMRPQSGA
jgi:hypothetical protein